ncbi:MAG TPA: glycosyltransferase family 39 protein [Thermoanaerobaculia bacterium]|jgi:4-amino-4-deoxy-L-arabinose transferase-like glycosyltransferase|nr:glycosyltransferase family 39 protein [Thermoanaerobaculia bacterium]
MIPRRRLATAILLAALGIGALSIRVGHPYLHTDEITYMSAVLESMAQKTVFPVYGNGAFFVNKPPLSLWMMRLSSEVLEPSPFAARLPSVLFAAATGVVLYLFGAALFGEGAGILAALIFLFTPYPLVLHGIRSATPDALEILLVTSAIVSLELWRRRRRPRMLACLVALLGTVAWVKSPFALVVFLVYLLATELPARRAGRGTPRLVLTLALAVGVWTMAYLLWLGALSTQSSPRQVARTLLVQQYARRIEGKMGKLEGPGYYLTTTVSDFGPLLLLPLAAGVFAFRSAFRKGWQPSGHDFACLAVWAVAAPLLATASASKLPWYTYLSYPGIALLIAVSAQSLSERKAIQAAILAACVLALAWRVPAGDVWPAQARYRGLTGRLWELASKDPDIVVVPGPNFELPRGRDDAYREARLFIRTLFWKQTQVSPGPDPCRATLVNRRRDMPGVEEWDVVELHRPESRRRGSGLWMIDACNGWLRDQLAAP